MSLIDPFGLDDKCYDLSGAGVTCPPGFAPGSTVPTGSVPQTVTVTPSPDPPAMFDASLVVVTIDYPTINIPTVQAAGTSGNVATKVATIGVDRSNCLSQAARAAGEDLIYWDVANKAVDVVDNLVFGGQKDALGNSLASSSSGTVGLTGVAIDVAAKGADAAAESASATQWIRGLIRSEGFAISAKRVASFARVGGKVLGVASLLLSANTGWEAYKKCVE